MYRIILLLLLPISVISQQVPPKWYKGNTHTHSLWSDGDDFPEMIMDWYKTNGYDFIALSDHNILADKEKWVRIPSHPFRQQRFKEYLEKFGNEWVEQKKDSTGNTLVRLKKLDEYRPLFEEKDKFLVIQAEEITDKFEKKPVHIGAVNVKELINPAGGHSVTEVMQNNLDQVYAQRQLTGQAMLAHINHPNFMWGVSMEDMMPLKGERFFEVYNGHPHVHNYGDSAVMGMEELWDRLLIHYIMEGKDLLYGLATDDAHHFIEFNGKNSNPGRGWIMVKAAALTPAALIEAMEKGDFYATTGVILSDVKVNNNRLQVAIQPEKGVNYTIQFWGAKRSRSYKKPEPELLKVSAGTMGSFKLKKKHLYVRSKVISDKLKENPFEEGDLETAWTQPVMR